MLNEDILLEIKNEVKDTLLSQIIEALGDVSLSPSELESKLKALGLIYFEENNDSESK